VTRAGAGPLTAFLIALLFSKPAQGYYYTFASVLNLQILAELGLGQIVVQYASHEWARLNFTPEGRLGGEPEARARLLSLGRFAATWYGVAAGLFAVSVTLGGLAFLQSDTAVVWQGPWIALCLFSAARLAMLPWLSLLEGCHQLTEVYRFRWVEGTLMPLTSLSVIGLGGELWALPASYLVSSLWTAGFLLTRYPRFLQEVLGPPQGHGISWRHEIFPVQWRIALSWAGGYFIWSLHVPFLFHYYGPVEAGRMGMTQALTGILTQLTALWMNTRAPLMGALIARRDFPELDRLFVRASRVAALLTLVGAAGMFGGLLLLQGYPRLAERFLPLLPSGLFLLAAVVVCLMQPWSTYLRAFKREPFAPLSIVGGMAVAVATWVLGRPYGALGLAVGYLALQVTLFLPWSAWLFVTCRSQWIAELTGEAESERP